jgi:hypothetical protein
MEQIMQAVTTLSPETMAELGILASAELYSVHDADRLGIELIGAEHDDLDSTDCGEVHHD